MGALNVVICETDCYFDLVLSLFDLSQFKLIALVPHFAKGLIEIKLQVSIKHSCQYSSHSLISFAILLKSSESVFKQGIHLLFVMFLCPKINLLQMYFLVFVDLEHEKENDFEFLVHNAINIFERLFDLPALMAVSQEFV